MLSGAGSTAPFRVPEAQPSDMPANAASTRTRIGARMGALDGVRAPQASAAAANRTRLRA